MAGPYQYPVFFECPSLDGEQRKRIENYFHIRRKSAGGDCGSVTSVNDEVYSVAFKDRDGETRDFNYLSVELGPCRWFLELCRTICAGESESVSAQNRLISLDYFCCFIKEINFTVCRPTSTLFDCCLLNVTFSHTAGLYQLLLSTFRNLSFLFHFHIGLRLLSKQYKMNLDSAC